jgi:hypothetical protein
MTRWSDQVRGLHRALPRPLRSAAAMLWHSVSTLRRRVPVDLLHGPCQPHGEGASVLVAGQGPWVEYLPDLFFQGPPEREPLARVPLWALPRTLERLMPRCSVAIARVDGISAHLLFDARYLQVPEWVEARLDVTQDLDALWSQSSSVQRDLQRIQRHGLTAEVSQGEDELRRWYDGFYLPFIDQRHAKYGHAAALGQLRRFAARGAVLWVLHRGKRIAGILLSRRGPVLYCPLLGILHGDYEVMRLGAVGAVYYHTFRYAQRRRCTEVRFGGTRGVLSDGEVRYKRKWGLRLVDRQDVYLFMLRLRPSDEASLTFLSQVPFTFRHGGGLEAVAAVQHPGRATGSDAQQAHHQLWIAGLQRLYLLSGSGWETAAATPPKTELLDWTAQGDDRALPFLPA